MTALQNGATQPTVTDLLTQMGSKIEVKVDGSAVISLSPSDLYYLNAMMYRTGLPARFSGAGADNQVHVIGLIIPFTRAYYPMDIDDTLGLITEGKTIEFSLEYPADANETDNREITCVATVMPGQDSQGWIERRTKTVASPSTGFGNEVDLPQSGNQHLYDLFFFQTTDITDGTTSDTTTVEQVRLLRNERIDILNDINLEALQILNQMAGTGNTDQIVSDAYGYISFDPTKSLQNIISLEEDVKIDVNAGDTNEFRVIPGIVFRA